MAKLGNYSLFDGKVIPTDSARLSIASSAVLYGLSVYSVFFAKRTNHSDFLAFRLQDHVKRLRDSSKMIGFSSVDEMTNLEKFTAQLSELAQANQPTADQFFRVTIHAVAEVPGVRTTDLALKMSVFMYDAETILPASGAKLKTSLWRRTADVAIPARAKVNGAYVNSALARQEALDAGCDDALFLNNQEYVSELSAANVFFVKNGVLYTPDCASDILEGITRRSVISLAKDTGLEIQERKLALTEFYTADEVFACGTSAFVSPIIEIDKRTVGTGNPGEITTKLREAMFSVYADESSEWTTKL